MIRYPTMRYGERDKAFVVSTYHSETKTSERTKINEQLVVDFGYAKHGVERFVKGMKYDLIEVPINQPMPEAPDENYLPVGILRVVVPSIGIVQCLIDHDPLADSLTLLYEKFVTSQEATKDMIPIVEFNANGKLDFNIVDWIEREPQFFGKRILPVPGIQPAGNK